MFGAELSDGGNVVDLSHIAPNTLDFIAAGDSAVKVAKAYMENAPPTIPRSDIELTASISKMDKVRKIKNLCIFGLIGTTQAN